MTPKYGAMNILLHKGEDLEDAVYAFILFFL